MDKAYNTDFVVGFVFFELKVIVFTKGQEVNSKIYRIFLKEVRDEKKNFTYRR